MKFLIKPTLFMSLCFSSLYATNGDNLIATGAKSRGMGGVGVSKSFGAESALANPALLTSVKSMEIAGSFTFFKPDVTYASDTLSKAQDETDSSFVATKSEEETNLIPEISFAHRINENLVYGVSVTGTASMGVDYSEKNPASTLNMKTSLQLLKIAVPFAYEVTGLSVGISPIVQFGTLEMSHIILDGSGNFTLLDNGPASDTTLGYEAGLAYDFSKIGFEGFSIGAVYKSELKMTYDNTISDSVAAFERLGSVGIGSGDDLDQPPEIGLGMAYTFSEHTVAFDYKHVAWGSAAGYKDFGWDDQDVYAIGYEYETSEYSLRVGYNYAKSPLQEQDGQTYGGAIKNSFNLAGFPGIVEKHYTLGGSYLLNDDVELDLAFVYADEVSESFNTTEATQVFGNALNGLGYDPNVTSRADATHSQFSLTVGATYKF